jgi:hypothetical protein
MSDESPKTPPLGDGDPPREVQQLIAKWRKKADEPFHHFIAGTYGNCADELSALLTAAGRDQQVKDLESRVDGER